MTEKIYCAKCRKKTGTKGAHYVHVKDHRWMIKGKCIHCGTEKAAFAHHKK